MGKISPGLTRWPPGAERRLVPAKSNLKPQTPGGVGGGTTVGERGTPRSKGGGRRQQAEGRFLWFGLGQGLCRRPGPAVSTRLCADTTGIGESPLSGLKSCVTVARPRTPWWHIRERDAAVPVCVACAGQGGRACMLVALAGHDGSHGCAAPGPARWRQCRSSASRPRRRGLVCLRSRCGLCPQGSVRGGGGGGAHWSYLCLPEHVGEPVVALSCCPQFTVWAWLLAAGPSGGSQRQRQIAIVGPGHKAAVAVGESVLGPQEAQP